jgi:hypothetical protein
MALTIGTPVKGAGGGGFGDLKVSIADVTFDSSYATGGEALTPEQVGLTAILGAFTVGIVSGTFYVAVSFDATNAKLMAFGGDGAAAGIAQLKEVASAVDLSACRLKVCFIGR